MTVAGPSSFLPIYATPRGAGFDGVAGLIITKPSGSFLCTGSLVGSFNQHIVTAAHCMLGATSVSAVFFPPGGGIDIVDGLSYNIPAAYSGNVIDENDISVVKLDRKVTSVGGYHLSSQDGVGKTYRQVGFGASGTGATGVTEAAGFRRTGLNRFDFTGADPVFGGFWGDQDVYFADFDNGLAQQDASCRLTAFFTPFNSQYCDLGAGLSEVLSAGGDSGGPLFVNGRLTAISSFGVTIRRSIIGDVDGVLNSS